MRTEKVAPLAGARIEMQNRHACLQSLTVAPLAGARIEMHIYNDIYEDTASLPSRERGLKFCGRVWCQCWSGSLPSRERGLKYDLIHQIYKLGSVAPLAGARIEMPALCRSVSVLLSLPSRERGLKYYMFWGENGEVRRSPRGSAD